MNFGKIVETSQSPLHGVGITYHTSRPQYIYLMCVFAALAVTVSLYMSIVVLHIPIERPFGGLFNSNQDEISWAPVWVAPAVSSLVAMSLLIIPRRAKEKLSQLKVGLLSLGVICLSAIITKFVMNVGFVILTKHATPLQIASVAIPMLQRNIGLGMLELVCNAWFLMLLAVIAAVGWLTID
jgi:hypothetical protein